MPPRCPICLDRPGRERRFAAGGSRIQVVRDPRLLERNRHAPVQTVSEGHRRRRRSFCRSGDRRHRRRGGGQAGHVEGHQGPHDQVPRPCRQQRQGRQPGTRLGQLGEVARRGHQGTDPGPGRRGCAWSSGRAGFCRPSGRAGSCRPPGRAGPTGPSGNRGADGADGAGSLVASGLYGFNGYSAASSEFDLSELYPLSGGGIELDDVGNYLVSMQGIFIEDSVLQAPFLFVGVPTNEISFLMDACTISTDFFIPTCDATFPVTVHEGESKNLPILFPSFAEEGCEGYECMPPAVVRVAVYRMGGARLTPTWSSPKSMHACRSAGPRSRPPKRTGTGWRSATCAGCPDPLRPIRSSPVSLLDRRKTHCDVSGHG